MFSAGLLALASVAMIGVGLYGVVAPSRLVALAQSFQAGVILWFGVAIRLVFALVLWNAAADSATPRTFQGIAVVALVAALVLPLLGATRIDAILRFTASVSPWVVRVATFGSASFGAFVLWSVSVGPHG